MVTCVICAHTIVIFIFFPMTAKNTSSVKIEHWKIMHYQKSFLLSTQKTLKPPPIIPKHNINTSIITHLQPQAIKVGLLCKQHRPSSTMHWIALQTPCLLSSIQRERGKKTNIHFWFNTGLFYSICYEASGGEISLWILLYCISSMLLCIF